MNKFMFFCLLFDQRGPYKCAFFSPQATSLKNSRKEKQKKNRYWDQIELERRVLKANGYIKK